MVKLWSNRSDSAIERGTNEEQQFMGRFSLALQIENKTFRKIAATEERAPLNKAVLSWKTKSAPKCYGAIRPHVSMERTNSADWQNLSQNCCFGWGRCVGTKYAPFSFFLKECQILLGWQCKALITGQFWKISSWVLWSNVFFQNMFCSYHNMMRHNIRDNLFWRRREAQGGLRRSHEPS